MTPAGSPLSLCQASSRDNDSWPKAFLLDGSPVDGARLHRRPGQGPLVQVRGHAGTADRRHAERASGRLRPRGIQGHRPGVRESVQSGRPPGPPISSSSRPSSRRRPSVRRPSVRRRSARRRSVRTRTARRRSVRRRSRPRCSARRRSVRRRSRRRRSARRRSVRRRSARRRSRRRPSARRRSRRRRSAPTEIAQAFSTAQTRSIIGVSATAGHRRRSRRW